MRRGKGKMRRGKGKKGKGEKERGKWDWGREKNTQKNSYKCFKKNSAGTLKFTFSEHQNAPLYY